MAHSPAAIQSQNCGVLRSQSGSQMTVPNHLGLVGSTEIQRHSAHIGYTCTSVHPSQPLLHHGVPPARGSLESSHMRDLKSLIRRG